MEFVLSDQNGVFKAVLAWIDNGSLRVVLHRQYPGPASAPAWERVGESVLSTTDLDSLLTLIAARPVP